MSVNSLKSSVKKCTPQFAKNRVRDARILKETLGIFSYDKQRFLKSYSTYQLDKNSQPQLEARITFHAHALEKGMSHVQVRYGFGESALKDLSKSLASYNKNGYDKKSKAYENALSVLRGYINLHRAEKYDIKFLENIFSKTVLEEVSKEKSEIGGVYEFDSTSKLHNRTSDFKNLFLNRWSVREYADAPVDTGKVEEAIDIAMKSPSICNRQASRVTVITDPNIIKEALRVQNGMNGYQMPPALLMVTTDTSAFVDVTERNQVYIDGGLFAMSLLMALEYVSLAACPLNAMLSVSRDKSMRKILDIPSNENIIMFISVGEFMTHNKAPKSFRYNSKTITREV